MPKNTIKYIAYFDTQDSAVKRNYVTSATNKVEYIAKIIASLGYQVEIHSVSEVTEDGLKFYSSEKKKISEGVTLHLTPSFGGRKRLLQKIKNVWHPLILFLYLLLRCGKKDSIVVYHSLEQLQSLPNRLTLNNLHQNRNAIRSTVAI